MKMFGYTNGQIGRWFTQVSGRLDPVSRGWAIVMGGNVGRMALSFVASVLVARALGPAAFGVYAVLGATIAIVGVVADMGLTVTEVKRVSTVWPDQPDTAHLRGRIASWLRTGAALLFFILAALLAVPIANQILGLSDFPNGPFLFILAMAGMVAVALSGTVSTILQATNHFGRLSTLSLVNAGLTTILAVVLFVVGRLNLVTALLILGIGTALVSFFVGYRLLPGRWSLWRLPSVEDLRQEGAALFRFSRWLWVASLFTVIIMQIDVILVGRLTTAAAVGMYGLALNLARKADIVNHSLYTSLLPAASSLNDREAVGKYLRQSMVRSGLISLGLLALMPLVGPFIRIFYGPEYAAATGLLQLLLIVVIIDAFALPVILLVFPLERPKLYAASAALQTVILLLLAVWLIPLIGTPGAAVAKIVARITGFALVVWRLRLWRLSVRNKYS
jgi:O-antigen/teichoic acid export membrane protein